jgi:hypothetical protein
VKDFLCWLDLWYVAALEQQIGRLHREGQVTSGESRGALQVTDRMIPLDLGKAQSRPNLARRSADSRDFRGSFVPEHSALQVMESKQVVSLHEA